MMQTGKTTSAMNLLLLAALRKLRSTAKVVFLYAALGMVCSGVARAQIAPGPLSRAHADLDSVTKCTSCHDPGTRRLKCLDCHTEIRRRIEAKTGFHSRAYKSSVDETDCARCHAEHRGSKTPLIPLDRQKFDHSAQTGFVLEGKHREQKCENCHTIAKIAPSARSEIKVKNLNQSFLGLRRECTGCHQEPHQNQLGTDCLKCHAMAGWKPASKFNHAGARFQLTGQHQQIQCAKCHSRNEAGRASETQGQPAPADDNTSAPKKLVLFKGLSFNGCPSCHTDPHHGAFQDVKLSGKCEECHNTGGWKNNRPGKEVNHSLAKFRLVGKHTELACSKCHKQSDFKRPIAHELCRDCHEDPHKGQFASRAEGSDCSACHNTTSYKPPLFDRTAHMRVFPLEGKHSTLECVKCHQPAGRDARYKTGKLLCPACHTERADPHGGEFAAEPHSNKCDQCHTQAGFTPTTFTVERHAQTQFPLTGKHTEVECHKCHKPLAPEGANAAAQVASLKASIPAGKTTEPDSRRQYRFPSRNCDVCHTDPHGISPEANLACATCHVTQEWKSPLPFDHSRTRFNLAGSHQDPDKPIACTKCHKPSGQASVGAAATAPVFSRVSTDCSRCHVEKDPHGGQFSSAERQTDCSSCHAPAAWKPSTFNHSQARFVMDNRHRNVDCQKCHKDEDVKGKTVRIYRDTPVECVRCHK